MQNVHHSCRRRISCQAGVNSQPPSRSRVRDGSTPASRPPASSVSGVVQSSARPSGVVRMPENDTRRRSRIDPSGMSRIAATMFSTLTRNDEIATVMKVSTIPIPAATITLRGSTCRLKVKPRAASKALFSTPTIRNATPIPSTVPTSAEPTL